jgi:Fe-Mn family superoxide dismutase
MFYRKVLPYNLNDLEPYIDTETMNEHYNVHFKTYTDNLNKEVWSDVPIFYVLRNYKNYSTSVRNNAGGYYNHILYFDNISPYFNIYEVDASDELKLKIIENFGSYENFLKLFKEAGLSVFGSGWVFLIEKNGKLLIGKTKNQDNPLMEYDCKILLAMDVWEHAYYLKHKAKRGDYIDDFFNVVNWKQVSENLL